MEASGHTSRLVRARDALRGGIEGDMLLLGSPTRIGTMTRTMRKFLKRFDAEPWRGRPVAAFDTEALEVLKGDGASAAAKMHDMARARGVRVHTPVLKVGVAGVKGPLSPGSDAAIAAYVKEFLRAADSWDK